MDGDPALPEELRASFPDAQAQANLQHTPLVVDGLMYMSSAVGAVVALDPTTGKTVWYDSLPPRPDGQGLARAGATRSIAYWTDGKDARIVTNVGANLVALNAKTGKRYADFGENGQVDLTKGFERPITGWRWSSGPIVVKDVVVVAGVPSPATDILNERARAPKEMPPDDVRGYDVRTGKLLWTFHVVPRKGEFGNETWLNDSWTYSGNSGAWSLLSADEELGYVYLPFEEATGDYYGGTRPGNNLFAESIVCLDARTGKRVWHFQTIHHGLWDYDLPAAPVLGDITVNGRRIKAVAQVSKQAFVYVFDRVTGQPVWPIVERPVPQGNVPGEWYSPTQPIPSKPPAFDQQGVSDSDLIDFTPELKAEAKKIVSEYKTGPLYTPPVLLGSPDGPKGLLLVPGTNGGADWGGAAFDPETGMLYVPSAHMPTVIALGKSQHPESTLPYREAAGALAVRAAGTSRSVQAAVLAPRGDRFEQGRHRMVGRQRRRPAQSPGVQRTEPAATRRARPTRRDGHQELRVHGRGERQRRAASPPGGPWGGKKFRAFDKKTGRIAWEMELPAGVSNAPMTYMAKGKQYIVVGISGRQYPGEFVALALP